MMLTRQRLSKGKYNEQYVVLNHNWTTENIRHYPTGSSPGKFYGAAKVHKLKQGESVDNLPIRPIISNIGTASYHLAKYLAKLLSPLSQSEYTISSTDNFINYIRFHEQILDNYKLI
jgi:hypothetical protein